MRLLIMIIIGLGVGGAMYFFMIKEQKGVEVKVKEAQMEAQVKADAYKANQAKMMKELGQ